MSKLLVIRFSSIGDIAHCAHILPQVKIALPRAEVHWTVRADFADFLKTQSAIDRVWIYQRETGLIGLWRLAQSLTQENFDHIYDAHNNLRSHLLCFFLKLLRKNNYQFVRRSKSRWKRYLLFKWRKNLFPSPFIGAHSFSLPLTRAWNWPPLTEEPPLPVKNLQLPKVASVLANETYIALAPSAAWALKRWPISHWQDLVLKLAPMKIVLLGGPADKFCADIKAVAAERVFDLSGQLSWAESAAVIEQAQAVVSGDTGALHLADLRGRPSVAIIGPTAFGFPFRNTSITVETKLSCRPCTKDGRGDCKIQETQKCLKDISAQQILAALAKLVPDVSINHDSARLSGFKGSHTNEKS